MEDCTIRPSMKSVNMAYLAGIAITGAAWWLIYRYAQEPPRWLYLIPLIVLWAPVSMHLKRRAVTLRFHDGHLTLETGFLSRSRRTLDMAKIQDVTVRQTFGQRLMGVGDIMLESAGESGAMEVHNLDRPREIADAIISSSKKG
jgi:uncharacterized membrane protein YdbT with pleckstrin-like domain